MKAFNQVSAVTGKAIKEFMRERMVLFWTYAVPLFFLMVLPVMYNDAPSDILASLKGGLTITMLNFMTMTAGQSNLPGSIATDREKGVYLKMASMPVSPMWEGMGRVIAVWFASTLGALIILALGIGYGAVFTVNLYSLLQTAVFSFLVALASTGIGFIIAALVKGESAATHTGVAITLLTYFLGGMAIPYDNLPDFMKALARVHPIPSANASMIQILIGQSYTGYDALTAFQISTTVAFSVLLFSAGLLVYTRNCWRRTEN
jgi:ABC-2 type transport system permease protein